MEEPKINDDTDRILGKMISVVTNDVDQPSEIIHGTEHTDENCKPRTNGRSDKHAQHEPIGNRKGTLLFVERKKDDADTPGQNRQSHFFDTLELLRRKTLATIMVQKKYTRSMIYYLPTWLLIFSGLTCWIVFNSNRETKNSAQTVPTVSPVPTPDEATTSA